VINALDLGCEANMKEDGTMGSLIDVVIEAASDLLEPGEISDINCIVDGHRFGEFGECLVCGHITNDENFDSMFETTEDLFDEYLNE
jgi:hypothetical protein